MSNVSLVENVRDARTRPTPDSYLWATTKTVILGDFYEDPTIFGLGIRAGLGCIPVVGQILDLSDTAAWVVLAYERGLDDPEVMLNGAILFIGYVPGVGDLLRSVLKGLVSNRAVKGLAHMLELVLNTVSANQYKALKNVVHQGWDQHVSQAISIAKEYLTKFRELLVELNGYLPKRLTAPVESFISFIDELHGLVEKGFRKALEKPRELLDKLLKNFEETRFPTGAKGTASRVDGVVKPNKTEGIIVRQTDALVDPKTPRELLAELTEGKRKALGDYNPRDKDSSWRNQVTASTPMVRVAHKAEVDKLLADGRVLNHSVEKTLADPVERHQALRDQLFTKNERGAYVLKENIGVVHGGSNDAVFPISAHGPADSGYSDALLDPTKERYLIRFKDGMKKSAGNPSKVETEYLRPLWINIDDVEYIGDVANNRWIYGSPANPGTRTVTPGGKPASSADSTFLNPQRTRVETAAQSSDANYRLLKHKASKVTDPDIKAEMNALSQQRLGVNTSVQSFSSTADEKLAKISAFDEKVKALTAKIDGPKNPYKLAKGGRAIGSGTLDPNEIHFLQPEVKKNIIDEKVAALSGGAEPGVIKVVEVDGDFFALDGSHELYAAQKAGKSSVPVRAYTPEQYQQMVNPNLPPFEQWKGVKPKEVGDFTPMGANAGLSDAPPPKVPLTDPDYRTPTMEARPNHPNGADAPGTPCTTGEPIDLVSGAVIAEEEDFALPGPLPLKFSRVWSSTRACGVGPLGRGWTHSLDQSLRVEEDRLVLRAADGRSIYFRPLDRFGESSYNRGARLRLTRWKTGFTVHDENHLDFAFSDVGRFDGALALVGIVDRNDNRITLNYQKGLLVEVIDSAGRPLQFINNEDGFLSAIDAPPPVETGSETVRLVSYLYDEEPHLVGVEDVLSQRFTYEYDDQHLIVQHTDRNKVSFFWEYDTSGLWPRCTKSWGDDRSFYRELEYDRPHRITTVKDGAGNTWVYHGHYIGMVKHEIDPLGNEIHREYDDDGYLLSETNGAGQTTCFEYDPKGRLIATIDPLGARSEKHYDYQDHLVTLVDPAGQAWQRKVDSVGNIVSALDPQGGRWGYSYDKRGLPLTVTDPAGHTMQLQWDAAGNLARSTDRAGASTEMVLDGWGRLLTRKDAAGGTTHLAWDLKGRLIGQTDAAGRSWSFSYDGEGNLIETTGPLGEKQRYSYGPLGRMVRLQDALGHTSHLKYNSELKLVAVKDARGKKWRFERDPLGRVIEETAFDGRHREYGYDAAGRLITTRDALGRETRMTYDAGGRLLERTLADGHQERFTYDALGRLTTAQNDAGTLELSYDALGNVTRQAFNGDTITARFDPCGNRIQRSSPLGHELTFSFDPAQRLTAVNQGEIPLLSFNRNALGLEIERRALCGLTMARSYLPTGELQASRTHLESTLLSARDYQYSTNGRLARVEDQTFGMVQYQHDLAGRLEQAIYPDHSIQRFATDPAGNVPGLPELSPAEQGRNRYTQVDDWTLSWDEDGNLLEKKGQELHYLFEYDAAGRLTQVIRDVRVPASDYTKRRKADPARRQITSFTYDALGRRVAKQRQTSSGEVDQITFLWDGNVPLGQRRRSPAKGQGAEATEGQGVEATEYVFNEGGFSLMAQLGEGQDCFVECDHLDTPRAAYDSAGEVIWQADYAAFGALREERGQQGLIAFRFPGQFADDDTGLYYNRCRYYDPELRMYTSSDPLGLRAGENDHNYVDDPLSFIDPFGLACTAGTTGANNTDFLVSPEGTAYPVPQGAQGPTPVINPQGKQTGSAFTGGNGGANKQVDTVRIMDSTPPRGNSPGYPNGYVKYQNAGGQGVDPYSGRTIPNSQSHYPID